MNLNERFLATAIGSFPQDNAEKALDMIFDSIPESPVWPQLPKRGLKEQMEIQYSEGIPRLVIDNDNERMYFDTSGDYSEEFAEFYEIYLAAMEGEGTEDSFAPMAISQDFSKGIYAFEERLKKSGGKLPYLKVHTTGPCSFALSIVDENKRAIYYNEEFRDIVVKAIAMKCRWQIQKFKDYADKIICFIDEPILSAFGSSTYVGVKREDVVTIINEVVEAIHMDGAIAGVHCCGNTDWSILIDAGVDLVNFDAFEYGETIALYPDSVKSFIENGGILAWGVVPTSDAIRENDAESLVSHYEKLADNLSQKSGLDIQAIYNSTIVTPSCGTGSLEESDAEKVFATLKDLSKALREKHK